MSATRFCRAVLAVVALMLIAALPAAGSERAADPVRVVATPLALGELGSNAEPRAINDSGVVVGTFSPTSVFTFRSFRWEDGEVVELPGLGGTTTFVTDVNNAGYACGFAEGPDGVSRAVVWEPDGTLVQLGVPGVHSRAYFINELGTVVGETVPGVGAFHTAIWRKGTMVVVSTPGGEGNLPSGLNDRGQVALDTVDSRGVTIPFVWDDGVLTPLPMLDPDVSMRTSALNRRGEVAGLGVTPDGLPAGVVWSGSRITVIPGLGGGDLDLRAINDRGVAVGRARTATGEWHGFAYRDGVTVDLGTLGGDEGFATDLNRRGQIIGWSNREPGGVLHATLWDDGRVVDLAPGPAFSRAADINRRGEIVGSVLDGPGGTSRAVLWTLDDTRR